MLAQTNMTTDALSHALDKLTQPLKEGIRNYGLINPINAAANQASFSLSRIVQSFSKAYHAYRAERK